VSERRCCQFYGIVRIEGSEEDLIPDGQAMPVHFVGVIALLLAAGGLCGTLLYVTSQRRRELGIRMAIGAAARRVQVDVLTWGLSLGAAGVAIGVPSAIFVGRFLRSWLWEVSPTDPTAFIGGSVVLSGAAAIASWLPAYRASRTDPSKC
jgi:ABC-type antimicrobial peptide transport system permease subunit